MGPRELGSDVNQAAVEIDVIPSQPQQLGEPHSGVQRRRDQISVSRQRVAQQPRELVTPEHPLRMALGARALTSFKLLDWALRDPAVAHREAQYVVQCP